MDWMEEAIEEVNIENVYKPACVEGTELKKRVKLDGDDGGIGIDRIVESVEGGEARR